MIAISILGPSIPPYIRVPVPNLIMLTFISLIAYYTDLMTRKLRKRRKKPKNTRSKEPAPYVKTNYKKMSQTIKEVKAISDSTTIGPEPWKYSVLYPKNIVYGISF